MNDLRLITLFVVSSLIGALGAVFIIILPAGLLLMVASGEAEHIDAALSFVFFVLFVIDFALAGALTATMMRSFAGSHIISIKEGFKSFATGSVIGGLFISLFLSTEGFMEAVVVGVLITYAIGGRLCWQKMRSREREPEPQDMISLNLNGRK